MTVLDRHAVSPADASAKRSLAAVLGLALIASIAFLFHRVAPDAPAIIPTSFAGVSGLAALTLAIAVVTLGCSAQADQVTDKLKATVQSRLGDDATVKSVSKSPIVTPNAGRITTSSGLTPE